MTREELNGIVFLLQKSTMSPIEQMWTQNWINKEFAEINANEQEAIAKKQETTTQFGE